ncbi:ribosyldihydronicotinamide dehydrogenase [quinone]-like [Haliotis rubra]|uniref:ribosyldihydronicotinamide dehydrogenase [quinone]-like n=1 Tax=Haliotis rubra TaxID=36100 RepID=UPI001EE61D05|nr:ribosyldihydronicotinamide dehydrogenase [quinone]-like [Haliotis rubra]XP_046565146.1 ribosyldihydronicotinamide dehydrogenase [quinone]-like [Haliotis rubra]XP_046565220.1 ribosyldihydronicotinamide dehydrogenase [quinone]-like [Haliotis rubra]XP_046565279.1 ribosyldihydronicotinamide dehydrogenase [quinone]-like [Haliotis rubra]
MAKNLIQSFESGHIYSKQQKNVLIVYAHQEPKSFNGALLRKAVETLEADGHSVEVSDLYAMHFYPISGRTDIVGSVRDESFFKYQMETKSAWQNGTLSDDIKVEMEKLKRADLVIFQFPLYWFSYPAILKGWIDRVYVMGFAYGGGKLFSDGPLKGKRGMLSFTTGGTGAAFCDAGMFGDMNVLLWPLQNGMLRAVGLDVLAPKYTMLLRMSVTMTGSSGWMTGPNVSITYSKNRLSSLWTFPTLQTRSCQTNI